MRRAFAEALRCPACQQSFDLEARVWAGECLQEGALRSSCGETFPVIAGIPRILPPNLAATLLETHPDFFRRHPDLTPPHLGPAHGTLVDTLRAFGEEWQRFPELMKAHERMFAWYFEGPEEVRWDGLHVLDAGCGMGRWLHFARRAGAQVVGLDLSPAIEVAAQREGEAADFVQADLLSPPFPPASFDLVYSFGVLHHLEDPVSGVRALAALVRPGGELRFYVYRSLEDESGPRRALLRVVTLLRRITTRFPAAALHAFSWAVAATATALFLFPRRVLRGWPAGERLTRDLPLVHYADVPFRLLVAEQFDRFGAPIERRYRREEIEGWLENVGLEVRAILPGLGWRAIGRRPS